VIVGAVICGLVGCTASQPRRVPYAGGDPAAVQSALAECQQEATMAAIAATDPSMRTTAQRTFERQCMERRGYTRQ
jgi:hypothetical protein